MIAALRALKAKPAWQKLSEKAARILYESDNQKELQALDNELRNFINGGGKGTKRPEVRAMQTVSHWRQTGELKTNYDNLNDARLQMWRIENYCPIFGFQKLFLNKMVADYPNAPGPKRFLEITNMITEPVSEDYVLRDPDFVVLRRPGATKTIFGCAGLGGTISGMSWTMFDRVIAKEVNANLVVVRDANVRFYLAGIKSLGTRTQTVQALQRTLTDLGPSDITAIGGSLGVFGALHLSCELGIKHVVASSGPTSLEIGFEEGDRQWFIKTKEMADRGLIAYPDLAAEVAKSQIRRVDFFLGGKHDFDMRQMRNLADRTDVVVPHIYHNIKEHSTILDAVVDGSLLKAFSQKV